MPVAPSSLWLGWGQCRSVEPHYVVFHLLCYVFEYADRNEHQASHKCGKSIACVTPGRATPTSSISCAAGAISLCKAFRSTRRAETRPCAPCTYFWGFPALLPFTLQGLRAVRNVVANYEEGATCKITLVSIKVAFTFTALFRTAG